MEATKDLRDRVWTEDEFDRFFEREAQKEGNSEKFRAVAEAYAQPEGHSHYQGKRRKHGQGQ